MSRTRRKPQKRYRNRSFGFRQGRLRKVKLQVTSFVGKTPTYSGKEVR